MPLLNKLKAALLCCHPRSPLSPLMMGHQVINPSLVVHCSVLIEADPEDEFPANRLLPPLLTANFQSRRRFSKKRAALRRSPPRRRPFNANGLHLFVRPLAR